MIQRDILIGDGSNQLDLDYCMKQIDPLIDHTVIEVISEIFDPLVLLGRSIDCLRLAPTRLSY